MTLPTPARPSSATATFGLLRHGITRWNEEKRIQGQLDSPLSPTGRQVAETWGRRLAGRGWQRLLVSDLDRARETAAIINAHLDLPIGFDSRLRELAWGDWEGRRLQTIAERYPEELQEQTSRGWDFTPPGGESRRHCLLRTSLALAEAASRWPGQRILVVCHHGVIKALVLAALGNSYLPAEAVRVERDALQILRCAPAGLTCQELNIRPESLP